MSLIVADTFYTYIWLRKDGTAYYVGKGTKRRAFISCEGHRPPRDESHILVQNHASEADAFAAEIFLISYYGRKDLGTGCLRNLTDGGDGVSNPSPEARNKMRQAKLGRKRGAYSELHRQHIAAANTGFQHTDASREKMSSAKQGKPPWNKGKANPHLANVVWTPEMREAARIRAARNPEFERTAKVGA